MSSDDISIRVSNLGKCYQIYERPQDRLKQSLVPRLRRRLGQPAPDYFREFWALRDVSFEVRKGETVGIIGRNGSGKSTLLQIICGTLTPTTGTVETSGRVAALLELGAGFNPEFTGRENVYLNGSVLGLSREEIDERFDAIAGFADIGVFIDQAVKTYSSGMYVRLAFAVAVNVNADILVVDEALSVGDMYFQAKCMAHMKRLMESGLTVLFVSHDVAAVKALCRRAVYLDGGKAVSLGATEEVVEAYYGAGVKAGQRLVSESDRAAPEPAAGPEGMELHSQEEFCRRAQFHRLQNGVAQFLNVLFIDESNRSAELLRYDQGIILRMIIRANVDVPRIGLAYHIRDRNGFDVVYSDTGIEDCHIDNLRSGEALQIDWQFRVQLRAGDYSVAAMLSIPEDLLIGKVSVCDFVPIAATFKVEPGSALPLYGAVHWPNAVTLRRLQFGPSADTL